MINTYGPCGLDSAFPWDTASRVADGEQKKQQKHGVFIFPFPHSQVWVISQLLPDEAMASRGEP